MPEHSPIASRQRELSAYLRDPERVAAPADIEPRRLAIYRELVFNNLDDLLAGNFPVIRALHDQTAWQALVRAFLRDHRSQTPLFTEIAREFIGFLEARVGREPDPPFLVELAHYEWSELALALDEADLDAIAHDAHGDVIDGIPLLSPLARLLAYRFPVHHVGPAHRPLEAPAQPTLIVLVRNRADQVGFLEVEPLTALLFEQMAGNINMSGRDCLHRVLAELDRDTPTLRESGIAILHELRRREVLLGTRSLGDGNFRGEDPAA